MNTSTTLVHTYLKNTDLHALSAYEAITTYLKFKSLHHLKKYTRWEIGFAPDINPESALKSLLEESFSLLNVNKEAYFTGDFPVTPLKPNEHLFRVEVFSNQASDPQNEETLMQSICQKTGLTLTTLKKSLVWELSIIDTRSRDLVEADALHKVILTTSRQEGLLVSPLYEIARFI